MDKRKPNLRLATVTDLEEIVKLYDHARSFMRSYGNDSQWPDDTYPCMETARADLEDGMLYVAELDGEVVGTFAFVIGPDGTYAYIEDGSWRSDCEYGVIHRMASRGCGVFAAAVEFALGKIGHIRVDTHADNGPMRHLIEKAGFSYRGIIYVEDGTPRLAYDYLKEAAYGTDE